MRPRSLLLVGSFFALLRVARANSLEGLAQDCEMARVKCAYRTGCGASLRSYMVDCADVLAGRTSRCPWACKRALISLTSSEAGLALSSCDCGRNEFCQKSKERAEVCRPEVAHATADDTVVSCSVAQWICAADPLCSTALDYYHGLCKSLFHGRKCTPRCNNSLAILDRQHKAAKLRNCYCDGSEDFPCLSIRENTQRLCFGRDDWVHIPSSTDSPPSSGADSNSSLLLLLGALIYLCVDVAWRTELCLFPQNEFPKNCALPERNLRNYRNFITTTQKRIYRRKTWPWWWTSEVLR